MALTVKVIFTVAGFPASEKLVIARFDLDNSYPAQGYPITPEMFGLAAFAGHPTGVSAIIRPFVLSHGFPLLMDVDLNAGQLRVYYPTGGATAAPGAVADPVASGAVPAGAVAVTSTSAQPTIPSALTPGRAKEIAVGTNLSGFSAILLAVGH